MTEWVRKRLGKVFSVEDPSGVKYLEMLLYAFVFIALALVFAAVSEKFTSDPNNPFNAPAVIGLLISLVAFYWSAAISLSQREISRVQIEQKIELQKHTQILRDQNKEISDMMAAIQKYCFNLHIALDEITEDIVRSIEVSAGYTKVTISLYISSFAFGCISDPDNANGSHALDNFCRILKCIREFANSRLENEAAHSTELHFYVWDEEVHREAFSVEAGGEYQDILIKNKVRIQNCLQILQEIFQIYGGNLEGHGDLLQLYVHRTGKDIMRFFQVRRSDTASRKLKAVETSMLLMMPSIGGSIEQSSTRPGEPDLACMLIWDGTEKGRFRMDDFFERYKKTCCDAKNDCNAEARDYGRKIAADSTTYLKNFFGSELVEGNRVGAT